MKKGFSLVANVQIGFIDYNNSILTSCVYGVFADSLQISGDFIPNCVNMTDYPTAFDEFEDFLDSC